MTKEEALKAMLDGKKVRHDSSNPGVYFYYDSDKSFDQAFRIVGNRADLKLNDSMKHIDGYELVKTKVKKYKAVYKASNGEYYVSTRYYKDQKDFNNLYPSLTFVYLIEDSMIEVEEDE